MTVSAIIVAAGSGQRLGLNQPKAFVQMNGQALLHYSLRTLVELSEISEAVIALPEGFEARARQICEESKLRIPVKLVRGGVERQDSVRAALEFTASETEIVVIHDAARPLASPDLFRRCIAAASRVGGAITAIPVSDTLKHVEDALIVSTLPRSDLFQAQTPQAFRRELLIRAHQDAVRRQAVATDDSDLVEQIGGKVAIVAGSRRNLKITTQEDLELAESLTR